MSQDFMNNCSGKLTLINTLCWFSSTFSPNILWGSEWVKTPWIIAVEKSLIKNIMLIFIYLLSQYSLGKWMSQDSMNNCRGKLSLIKNIMMIFIYLQSQYSLGKWMSQDSMNNCSGKLPLIKYIMLIFIYLQS